MRKILLALITLTLLSTPLAIANRQQKMREPSAWFDYYMNSKPQGVYKSCRRGREVNSINASWMDELTSIMEENIRDGDCTYEVCNAQTAGFMRAMRELCPSVW